MAKIRAWYALLASWLLGLFPPPAHVEHVESPSLASTAPDHGHDEEPGEIVAEMRAKQGSEIAPVDSMPPGRGQIFAMENPRTFAAHRAAIDSTTGYFRNVALYAAQE